MSGDHDGGAFRPRDLSPKTPSPDISFLSDTRQGNLQEHTLGPTTSETIGGGAGVSWGFLYLAVKSFYHFLSDSRHVREKKRLSDMKVKVKDK